MIPKDSILDGYADLVSDSYDRFDNLFGKRDISVITVQDDEDGLCILSCFTAGVAGAAGEPVEFSYHVAQDPAVATQDYVDDFVGRVERRLRFEDQEIIDGQMTASPGFDRFEHALLMRDRIFGDIAVAHDAGERVVPIITVVPLTEAEVVSLSAMPPRVRPDVLTHLTPHQFCDFSRDTRSEYTVERAVRLLWHEIRDRHAQHNTYAYQSVLAAADFAETEDKAIAQLEGRLGRRLPVDLAYSWKIQGRRCYLTDYQYIDARRVLDFMFPDTAIEGFAWNRDLIPFLEDSGGNMVCVDCSADTDQQIVLVETHEGPIRTETYSFYSWLAQYRADLTGDVYRLDDDGFLEPR